MIITKTILVNIASQRTHYENKGYDLTPHMHKNDKGKLVLNKDATIEIKVEDLPPRSKRKVLARCDNPECGKERWVEYDKYTSLCHFCALQTEAYKINNGNANRGKKRTQEVKDRMSKAMKISAKRGEESPNWKPELTQSERDRHRDNSKNKQWKKDILKKYNHQCVKCGSSQDLNTHHIESYFTNKDSRWDIDNGIVLCRKHHREFHAKYGKTNTTKEQLEEYLIGKEQSIPKSNFPDRIKSRQGVKNVFGKPTSKYAGVSKNSNKNKESWRANIHYKYDSYYLGSFETEIEAALAYNQAALEFFGWKATLNNISQEEIESIWEN